MGRVKGQPERKSARKRESSRRNARAPRPAARRAASAGEEAALQTALTRLRSSTPAAVRVLAEAMSAPDPAVRIRAASEVLDRSGLPRLAQQAVSITSKPPKLVIIRDDFEPPESFGAEDVEEDDAFLTDDADAEQEPDE